MKNKIRKIIKGGWLSFIEALLCLVFGLSLVTYPESVSSKTILLVGVLFIIKGAKIFEKWLNNENVEKIKVAEPVLIKKEKSFDGGDDFKTFKAENGIID